MTDWSRFSDAYGSADDIPALLEQAGADRNSPAWSELWSRLCHQGGTCSASYAALPDLEEMARRGTGTARVDPLVLAGAILASGDWPADIDRPHVLHADTAARLHVLAEEALGHPDLLADSSTYVYVLQALLGFEGDEVWGQVLDGVNDGEYEVPCPHCASDNFIAFGPYGYFSTLDDMYMNDTGGKRLPLVPADPSAMDGLGLRLHVRALADGQPDVAEKLTYVFGSATCAECDTPFRVDEAVVARWGS
jgi:hypothetical protein